MIINSNSYQIFRNNFILRKKSILIAAYYKITSIDFTPDVLLELNIKGDYVIDKPSADIDKYYKFLRANGYERMKTGLGANKLKKERKTFSKSKLQSINQCR